MLLVGRYCLLVWGDAEETKGKRAAAMAWGWLRWSSAVVSLGDGMIITKI